MDEAWALETLGKFRETLRVERTSSPGVIGVFWRSASTPEQVEEAAQVAEPILDRALPGWRTLEHSRKKPNDLLRVATIRAIASIENAELLREKLGDAGPSLSASTFHPWVWESCKTFWASGHRREAVNAAARAVSARTQSKVSRRDKSEWGLIMDSFSTKNPEPGRPRLRLMDDDGGDTYKNLHEGAGMLAQGLYRAIRNPANHDELEELSEDHALEQLAAFSVLARWIDDAEVRVV